MLFRAGAPRVKPQKRRAHTEQQGTEAGPSSPLPCTRAPPQLLGAGPPPTPEPDFTPPLKRSGAFAGREGGRVANQAQGALVT